MQILKAIYWAGNITQLNDIGFVNMEVKCKISHEISKQKVLLPITSIFFKTLPFCLASKWTRMYISYSFFFYEW